MNYRSSRLRKIGYFFIVIFLSLISFKLYSQDSQEALGQIAHMLKSNISKDDDLIFGYSLWGLFGSFFFSILGFVAFRYGRKLGKIAPIIVGLVLMLYPYFLKNTIAIFSVGIVLTGLLYFFRE